MGLGSKHNQGGISPLAPPTLTRQLLSLPAMLHKLSPNAITRCSKAPRGLFVLLRVLRIFTQISISPSPSLRQCPDRYAIRAGRNLPDKEFRSVVPTPFPGGPDFILTDLDSSRRRSRGSSPRLRPSDGRPSPSSEARDGTSRNPHASSTSTDARRKMG